MEPDEIVATWDAPRRQLLIRCGDDAFAHIATFAAEQAATAGVQVPTDEIERIQVFKNVAPAEGGWRDRLALFGCGIAVFVVLFGAIMLGAFLSHLLSGR